MDSQLVQVDVDAFLPPAIAARMEAVGVKKAGQDFVNTFALAVLAGAFIACGAFFSTTVTAGLSSAGVAFGITKLIGGLAFCLGLVAVIVAGAELFTGNNLIAMAVASGRVSLVHLLRNWSIVYVGNFVGAMATAGIMLLAKQYTFGGGAVGANALYVATSKCELSFVQAVALGAMCNALVCLAVWLAASARSTTDKIMAMLFPITAFVAAGFEHSIANMYYIPLGLFIKASAAPSFWTTISKSASDFADLSWSNFFVANLVPVTIGNIIGGAGMVGLMYWFIFLRPRRDKI
jgi:formate transporter